MIFDGFQPFMISCIILLQYLFDSVRRHHEWGDHSKPGLWLLVLMWDSRMLRQWPPFFWPYSFSLHKPLDIQQHSRDLCGPKTLWFPKFGMVKMPTGVGWSCMLYPDQKGYQHGISELWRQPEIWWPTVCGTRCHSFEETFLLARSIGDFEVGSCIQGSHCSNRDLQTFHSVFFRWDAMKTAETWFWKIGKPRVVEWDIMRLFCGQVVCLVLFSTQI